MSRHEFIETLQAALNRSLTPSLVADHIHYYEEYIKTRVASGESERDVLLSLGDPRLIARTIVETNARAEGYSSTAGGSYQDTYDSEGFYRDSSYQDRAGSASYREAASVHRTSAGEVRRTGHQIPSWLFWVLIIGVIFLVIGLIVSVVSFLAPLLIPVIVIVFLVKLFRDWLN